MVIDTLSTLRALLDLWSSYSLTMRIVVFITIVAVLSIWIFLLPWVQKSSAPNTLVQQSNAPVAGISAGKDTPQVATKTELPSIRFGHSVEDLRTTNAVRELTNSENDLSLYHLPSGVFGWVEAYKLDSPQLWLPDSPLGPDFLVLASGTQIRKSKKSNSEVEIHKAQDGTVRLLAFVNDSTRLQLQQPSRANPIQVLLLFRQYEQYQYAVSIPRDRIRWFRHRSFGDGETVADASVT